MPPEGWREGTPSSPLGPEPKASSRGHRLSETGPGTCPDPPTETPPTLRHSLCTGSFPAPCRVPWPWRLTARRLEPAQPPEVPPAQPPPAPPPRAAHFPTHHSPIFLVSGRTPQNKAQRAEAIHLSFKAPKRGSWGLNPGECDHHDLIRTQGHLRRLRRTTGRSR